MSLSFQLIVKPSPSCRAMILRRMMHGGREEAEKSGWGAALLVQGQVAEVIAAVDVGTKASSVFAAELVGNCPQHINTVAFLGSVADVKQALGALKDWGKRS
jgi:microcompartment protein CcmL/EutN